MTTLICPLCSTQHVHVQILILALYPIGKSMILKAPRPFNFGV